MDRRIKAPCIHSHIQFSTTTKHQSQFSTMLRSLARAAPRWASSAMVVRANGGGVVNVLHHHSRQQIASSAVAAAPLAQLRRRQDVSAAAVKRRTKKSTEAAGEGGEAGSNKDQVCLCVCWASCRGEGCFSNANVDRRETSPAEASEGQAASAVAQSHDRDS